MEPKVIARDELKLVGVELPDAQHKAYLIPYLWASLCPKFPAIKQAIHPQTLYGVWYHKNQLASEPASYLAAVGVSTLEDLPAGMAALTVRPSQYAALAHRGDIDRIAHTYETLHRWMKESGYKFAAPQAPTLEIYDTSAPVTDHFEVLLLEPIK
jgi:AraC family transcriptional regulator